MSYIACGGYYKFHEGESVEDFDTCQCGGSIRYDNSIREVFRHDEASNISQNFKSESIKTNLYNSKNEINTLKTTPRVNLPKESYIESIPLLDRISLLGVFAGIMFFVISIIIAVFGVAGSIVSSNFENVMNSFIGLIIILIFLTIASGFIASYKRH